jgi:predicted GNAT family acetyltransferase
MSTFRNDTRRRRFELQADGEAAVARYRQQGSDVTFIHAEVPTSLAGQGIGSRLAKAALESVRAAGFKVSADCPFVAAYVKRHSREHDDILAERQMGTSSEDRIRHC